MTTNNTIDLFSTVSFTSREHYVAWRAQWRAEYKALSQEIRRLKAAISQAFKDGEYAGGKQSTLNTEQLRAHSFMDARTEANVQTRAYALSLKGTRAATAA